MIEIREDNKGVEVIIDDVLFMYSYKGIGSRDRNDLVASAKSLAYEREVEHALNLILSCPSCGTRVDNFGHALHCKA